jgi:hypothetical protein
MRLSIHGSDIGIFWHVHDVERSVESTSVRLIADLLPTKTIGYLLHCLIVCALWRDPASATMEIGAAKARRRHRGSHLEAS